jgi:hypothetical protein
MIKDEKNVKILVIIGAIVGIIEAIVAMASGNVIPIICGIIVIGLSFFLLTAQGLIRLNKKIPLHWIIVLIIGILFIWPLVALIGGIILIVAGILDMWIKMP